MDSGAGSGCARGLRIGCSCRSARCSASSMVRRAVVSCLRAVCVSSCVILPPGRACAAGSRQLRHAHAVEMAREGVPLNVILRQLGHANLGITSVYLNGIATPRSSTRASRADDPRQRRPARTALTTASNGRYPSPANASVIAWPRSAIREASGPRRTSDRP
jgi:integrase-like protein